MDRFEDVDHHPHLASRCNKRNNDSQGAVVSNNFRMLLQLCVANGLGRTRLSGRSWRFINIYNQIADAKFRCCNKFSKQATKPATDSNKLLLTDSGSILFVAE
jgi:hypothetical protein